MPTLSQLLHIDRRQTSESDSRAKLSYGISGLVSATTFDGKTIYLNKKTRTRHYTVCPKQKARLMFRELNASTDSSPVNGELAQHPGT